MKILRCSSKVIRDHKAQFVDLYEQLVYVHYPEKVDQGTLKSADYEKNIDKIIDYVENQEGVVYIAQEGTVILGYAHGYIRKFLDEKRMMLDGLVVDSKSRKKNIGKKLMSEIERYAKENHCDVIELFVTKNNAIAEGFYRKNGFVDSRLHMIKSL